MLFLMYGPSWRREARRRRHCQLCNLGLRLAERLFNVLKRLDALLVAPLPLASGESGDLMHGMHENLASLSEAELSAGDPEKLLKASSPSSPSAILASTARRSACRTAGGHRIHVG